MTNLNALVFFRCLCFTAYPSQALAPPGENQGSGIGNGGNLLATRYYRGYREYFAPDLVTPEGGGLNVGSAGMETASQLTWSGIIASTGNWRT